MFRARICISNRSLTADAPERGCLSRSANNPPFPAIVAQYIMKGTVADRGAAHFGLWTFDSGLRTWDSGLRTRDSGLGTRDPGPGTAAGEPLFHQLRHY